jgi:hypothetical protein
MHPRRRKGTAAGKAGSSKRPKIVLSRSPSPEAEEHDKKDVPWVLPSQTEASTSPDQSEATTRFARALYNQDWDTVSISQEPYGHPPLRTPLYKNKAPNMTANKDVTKSSAALRSLFNRIKQDTERNFSRIGGIYTREAFNRAFLNANQDVAVVTSTSAAHPILAIDEDYRVEV